MYSDATVISESEPVPESRAKQVNARRREGGGEQFVEFLLGEENYAINLFHTREVITQSEITPIPNTSSYITGIMDLRGHITTIIDLKQMMGITTRSQGKERSRIIILDESISRKPVGILVDDVYSVSTYTSEDIDRSGDDQAQNARSILGVIRRKGKDGEKEKHTLIIWLDIRAMIAQIAKEL